MLAQIIANNLNQIKDLCQQHKVKELYVFGSATTDHFNDKSDVDFLIEFEKIEIEDYANNYFHFIEQMESLLGRKIDLVTAKFLRNKFFIEELNETKQMLFAA